MFTLVLVAVYYIADAQPPIAAVTKPTLQTYPSKEACNADGPKQATKFMDEVPKGAIGFAGKCVEISGPAGNPA